MQRHFAEVMVQDILPAVRALVAKELTEKHKLTQQSAAEKIGVTQAAVSQYNRELRGWKVKFLAEDQAVMDQVSALSSVVAQSGLQSAEALKQLSSLCRLVRERHFSAGEELYPGLELCELKKR
jgi:predicted transcriptional regulator